MHLSDIRPCDSFTLDSLLMLQIDFLVSVLNPLSRAQLALAILSEVQTMSVHAFHTCGLPGRRSLCHSLVSGRPPGQRSGESGMQMGLWLPKYSGQKYGPNVGGIIMSICKSENVKS